MSDLQARIASAMERKRAELINLPLARIWSDLALAAIQECRTPNAETRAALDELLDGMTEENIHPEIWK